MKSNSNPDPSTQRNSVSSSQGSSAGSYSPTVPLSVYRELSAELQASKAMLDSLNAQNHQLTSQTQQLSRQNQQLRQEIEQLSASTVNLQQVAESPQPTWSVPSEAARANAEAIAKQIRPAGARLKQPASSVDGTANTPSGKLSVPNFPTMGSNEQMTYLFSEQSDPMQSLRNPASSPRDLSGLWLWFTVLAIILTAFGAGFMVMRPLLPSSGK